MVRGLKAHSIPSPPHRESFRRVGKVTFIVSTRGSFPVSSPQLYLSLKGKL